MNNFREVSDAIKKAFSEGKRSMELGQTIQKQFSLQ
jgi:hypothetical protein